MNAGGFLDVCGHPVDRLTKERMDKVNREPASNFMTALNSALAEQLADHDMCIAYVVGLEDGWQEGHEHGVIAAQFPGAWPKDEQAALKTLPLKQLETGSTAMKTDVPCIPDYVTTGQRVDIILEYIREQEKQNPFYRAVPMRRVIYFAYQKTFVCPATAAQPPITAK